MRSSIYLNVLATLCAVAARSAQHVGKKLPELPPRHIPGFQSENHDFPQMQKRQVSVNASSNCSKNNSFMLQEY